MTAATYPNINVQQVSQFDSGAGEGGSEVVSHYGDQLFVTNGAQHRIDIFSIAGGELLQSLDLTTISGYGGVNSVSAAAAGVAVAIENDDADANGFVALYDLSDLDAEPQLFEAGNLPDMVTFSKDGSQIFVANEGERTDGGDPAGSISIIDVATGTVQTFGFDDFDDQTDALRDAGVRIFPDAAPSTDFEPEYISEGADGNLYVTLQEANAVAVFDATAMEWSAILPLGTTDHSQEGFELDPSDKDDAINIRTAPVNGMHMPDAIATAEIDGETYFLTANEGDDRGDFDVGGDAARVEDILDGAVEGVSIDDNVDTTGLERLTVSIIDGDTDGDGDIDLLHSYGSRSFSIFDAEGNLVFDSGSEFETLIAQIRPANAFNNDDFPSEGNPDTLDENRSDNKGPEPEAITIGEIDGHTLAFVGLERDSGIMVYDITDPAEARFLDYVPGQDNGNVSPEVITFIEAADSANGQPQIAVSYEISGTTALFDLALGDKIKGTQEDDRLRGAQGDDMIKGRAGNDVLLGREGDDRLAGNAGDDTLKGNQGDDLLLGRSDDDLLRGGAGADTLRGGQGDDILKGGAGADRMRGAAGADEIHIFGDDSVRGGSGEDTFIFARGNAVIRDFDAGNDADRIDLSGNTEFTDYADLIAEGHLTQSGRHVLIDDLDGNTVTLIKTSLADLTADDFLF